MIKVEHIKTHIVDRPNGTASGKHTLHESVLVAPAKLVLVGCDPKESVLAKYNTIGGISYSNSKATLAGTYYQPIFISETELTKGEECWHYNHIFKTIVFGVSYGYSKILALSEHLSPQQLAQIVSGELKDGEKYLIECQRVWVFRAYTTQQAYRTERFFDEEEFTDHSEMKAFSGKHSSKYKGTYPNYVSNYTDYYSIKLNPHITIYPVGEKMYTIKEIIDELKYGLSQYGCKNELSGKWVLEDNIYYILNGLNKM